MSNKEFKVIGDPMDCLAEECAEVIKALMKIKRFGLEGHPGKPMKDGVRVSNRDELLEEMQDCEDRLNEVRAILGASRESRTLSAVPSEERIDEMAKEFGDVVNDDFNGISPIHKAKIIKRVRELLSAFIIEIKRGIAG